MCIFTTNNMLKFNLKYNQARRMSNIIYTSILIMCINITIYGYCYNSVSFKCLHLETFNLVVTVSTI